MRRILIIVAGLLAIVVCLGFFFLRPGGVLEKPLSDGSIIRIEKIAFGQQEEVSLGGPLGKLKRFAAGLLRKKASGPRATFTGTSWSTDGLTRTNEPALYVYISRRVPGKGYRSVDAAVAALIDEDGCVFSAIQSGGEDDGSLPPVASVRPGAVRYSVGWFRFEAFPRREKKFRFIIVATPTGPTAPLSSAEFSIANPAPPPKPVNWVVESLPATRTQGNLSVILNEITISNDNAIPVPANQSLPGVTQRDLATIDFQFIENGRPSFDWLPLNQQLYDSSGNYVVSDDADSSEQSTSLTPDPLCSRESAWKLRAQFFGTEKSHAASNAVWTLSGIAVPAPGISTTIAQSRTLQGVLIKVGAFGGPGDFIYSNNLALHAAPAEHPDSNNSSSMASWPKNWNGKKYAEAPAFTLHTKKPHLALDIGDLSHDQRLTVRAVDDQGREFYAHKVDSNADDQPSRPNYLGNWSAVDGSFLIVDLPEDAKTVDLNFCVHTCYTVEFIFKPPQPVASPAK